MNFEKGSFYFIVTAALTCGYWWWRNAHQNEICAPKLCPCGIDMKKNPHLFEICAPTLPERLLKMAAWCDKSQDSARRVRFHRPFFSISGVKHEYLQNAYCKISAFPQYDYLDQGCVYCGIKITYGGPFMNIHIKVGVYDAFLCPGCMKLGRRLCPFSMEPKDKCIKNGQCRYREASLCMFRLGVFSRDIRKVLNMEFRKVCFCCK